MKRVAVQFFPCLLMEGGRQHMNVCRDLQEEFKNDPRFLMKVVRGDESWCYGYSPKS